MGSHPRLFPPRTPDSHYHLALSEQSASPSTALTQLTRLTSVRHILKGNILFRLRKGVDLLAFAGGRQLAECFPLEKTDL